MEMSKCLAARNLTAALAMTVCGAPCWGAAAWLAEDGGSTMGMAGAGRAALSLDAAALAANPAALGELPASTVTAMVMPVDLDFEFRGSDATPAQATNHEGVTVVPGIHAVRRDDRLSYGLGVYSYLGLSFDAGNDWSGRRIIEHAGLGTLNIAPALSYEVSERLALGASVAAQLARPEARLAVASDAMFYGPPSGMPDGQLRLRGDSWAAGGQLGLLYRATDAVQIGLAWQAPVDHSVPLDLQGQGLHPVLSAMLPPDGAAKLEFELPQQLLFGVSHQSRDGTVLAAGLWWQDWSSFGNMDLRLAGQATPMFPGGLRDAWGASVGVRRPLGEKWQVAAGLAYDSNPAPDAGVPAYFPTAEQWRLAAGAQRTINEQLQLRLEMSVARQGDAKVVQTTYPLPLPGIAPLAGTYTDTRVYMVAVAADFTL
jgi:long-chain fatty acid transport protein